MKMYRADFFYNRIEAFEVEEVKNGMVTFRDRGGAGIDRQAMLIDWYKWVETYEDAKQCLINKQLEAISKTELLLSKMRSKLNELQQLQEVKQ